MGECGCASFDHVKAVKVGDNVLAVEIYHGCEDCATGLAVSLHLFTPEEAANWVTENAEPFVPDQYGHAQLDFPLLGRDELMQAAKVLKVDGKRQFGKDGYDNLVDFLGDYGLRMLQIALEIKQSELSRKPKRKRAPAAPPVGKFEFVPPARDEE